MGGGRRESRKGKEGKGREREEGRWGGGLGREGTVLVEGEVGSSREGVRLT